MRSALVAGLFLSLLAVALQGVLSEEELERIPSEDLCRPYIEKALKDLGTGSLEQTSAEVGLEVDQESREGTQTASEEAPADEAADHVSEEVDRVKDEQVSVEDTETAAGDSKEEQVEATGEEEEAGDFDKSEKDEGEQSEEAEAAESAEISAAQEGETEEAGEASAEVSEEERADSLEKVIESEEGSEQATERETEREDEEPDEEKSDEEAKVEDDESEEGRVDDEAKSEEEKDDTEESRIEQEQEESTEEVTLESKEETEVQQASAEEAGVEEDAESIEDRTLSDEVIKDVDEKDDVEAESEMEERASEEIAQISTTSAETDQEEEKEREGEEGEMEAMSAEEEEGKSAEEETKSAEEDQEKEAKSEEEEAKCDKDDAECERSIEQADEKKSEAKSEEEEEEGEEDATKEDEETETEKSEEEEAKSRGRRHVDREDAEATDESVGEAASEEEEEEKEQQEPTPEEDLIQDIEIPENLRPRDHINQLLKLDEENEEKERAIQRAADIVLRDLKRLYDNAIQPLESMYKYRDLSNRHFGDPEIFSKPLVLFMGPWSGGKSSIINYLLDIEYEPMSLRTGAEPSPAYFNIIMHGEEEEILDGTQLAADWTFSGLQKFGQGMLDRLRGLRLDNKLLEKVNIVEIPGILEIRKQVQRLFPFNDACQWFIDRADIIFLVYDPAKLDVGPETEAILDQLKGREYQTRIILNKADQVKPEELMRVQGALIWNISPLMSSAEPPIMYSTSLWSLPYEAGAPTRLLYAQERAFLRDLRTAINKRVEHKIASARRFAVRVRNHAKMVDCYLTTYYNHKTFFGDKRQISGKIIENPQDYHIYEGLSTLTNISRYDLPDPDVYRDFFRLNPLYDFPLLSSTCTYFRGCPINRLDVAIAYDLPELVGKYKKSVEAVLHEKEANSPAS